MAFGSVLGQGKGNGELTSFLEFYTGEDITKSDQYCLGQISPNGKIACFAPKGSQRLYGANLDVPFDEVSAKFVMPIGFDPIDILIDNDCVVVFGSSGPKIQVYSAKNNQFTFIGQSDEYSRGRKTDIRTIGTNPDYIFFLAKSDQTNTISVVSINKKTAETKLVYQKRYGFYLRYTSIVNIGNNRAIATVITENSSYNEDFAPEVIMFDNSGIVKTTSFGLTPNKNYSIGEIFGVENSGSIYFVLTAEGDYLNGNYIYKLDVNSFNYSRVSTSITDTDAVFEYNNRFYVATNSLGTYKEFNPDTGVIIRQIDYIKFLSGKWDLYDITSGNAYVASTFGNNKRFISPNIPIGAGYFYKFMGNQLANKYFHLSYQTGKYNFVAQKIE